ncbi:MAG TPA: arginase family protein [Candidatus Acidoferrum sp.]|nr:arginase family protein [Candidatus Acidoferrum sp.]
MAVKIVRQPRKIALIGAPSSAAAFLAGSEKAPAALRAAGLAEKLRSAGYEVVDHGDCAPRLFADDEDHRRARNLPEIVAGLNDLRVRAEAAVKSGAFVLVLGGDCAQAIGLLTGARRYYKHVSLLWVDRDADLNTPATTPSGRIDGMVVAHIVGRGAPELVRFWGEPPLVREPDVTLFALERIDPPEQEALTRSPIRHVYAADVRLQGAAKAAREALDHLHAREFVLHLDIDVLAYQDFAAVNVPDAEGGGGLRFDELNAALKEFAKSKNLLGMDVAQYNPDKDPSGGGAKKLVDLLVNALSARLEEPSEAVERRGATAESIGPAKHETPAAESPAAESREAGRAGERAGTTSAESREDSKASGSSEGA